MQKTNTIRWLIAHEPAYLFLRTANAFAADVREKTNGEIDIEVYTATEYADKFNNSIKENPMIHMENGNLEISQLHISQLWKYNAPAFMALELPFLFRDHDHATRTLEGEIGTGMLERLVDTSPARGLAFTYSGGYRVMISNEEINELSDFRNLKFYTGTNPIGIDTIESIGGLADPHAIDHFWQSINSEGDKHDAVDTTLPRILATVDKTSKRYITDTKHSMFLTSIIVAESWWKTLSSELKEIFAKSAVDAARLERKWSIEDAETVITDAVKHGLHYKQLDKSDMDKFRDSTASLYDKYSSIFAPGLVNGIIRS
jgi:TRAP-type transport system periplasmic protein